MRLGPLTVTRQGVALSWGKPEPARSRRTLLHRARTFLAANMARYSDQLRAGALDVPADDLILRDLPRIRKVSRYLMRNDALGNRIIRDMVLSVAGSTGPSLQVPGFPQVEKAWRRWSRGKVDPSGELSFAEHFNLALAEWFGVGEAFVVRGVCDGRFCVMLNEADRLAGAGFRSINQNYFSDGIEYDPRTGRKLNFVFEPPSYGGRQAAPTAIAKGGYEVVEASRVDHLYTRDRPSQTRGVPWFATTSVQFHDRSEIRFAALQLTKAAAYYGLTYESEGPFDDLLASMGFDSDPDNPNRPILSLESAAMSYLPKGSKVGVVHPDVPDPQFMALDEVQMREVSATAGLSNSRVTGFYGDVNYSSARMEARATMPISEQRRQRASAILLRPTLADYVRFESDFGDLNLSDDQIAEVLEVARWVWPPEPWHDPAVELEAEKAEMQLGYKTWAQGVAQRGLDPDEQRAAILAEKKWMDENNVPLPGPWSAEKTNEPPPGQGADAPQPNAKPEPEADKDAA